jgi:hypothetical protein
LHTYNTELTCKSGYLSLAGHSGIGYNGTDEYSRNQQGKLDLEAGFRYSSRSGKETVSTDLDVWKVTIVFLNEPNA